MEILETEINGTVSGGDAAPDTGTPQNYITLEQLEELLTQRQDDFVSALSTELKEPTFAEKPLEELTVSEGCLLLIAVLLLWLAISRFIGSIFK